MGITAGLNAPLPAMSTQAPHKETPGLLDSLSPLKPGLTNWPRKRRGSQTASRPWKSEPGTNWGTSLCEGPHRASHAPGAEAAAGTSKDRARTAVQGERGVALPCSYRASSALCWVERKETRDPAENEPSEVPRADPEPRSPAAGPSSVTMSPNTQNSLPTSTTAC